MGDAPSMTAQDPVGLSARARGELPEPWRCDVTGNPVGTDTRMIGAPPCDCQGCRAAALVEQLVAERDEALALNNRYAYERDKAREERDAAERRSETFWKGKVESAERALTEANERTTAAVEALDAAGYYIDRLRTVHAGRPVRDLDEAGEAFYRQAGLARARLTGGR